MTQQRALKTRAELLDAAATEFSQRGYAGGSVNHMLDVAACTKGAMYFHFASKRALAEAVLDAAEQAYSAAGQRWPTTGDVHPIEAVAHMVDAVADLYERDPEGPGRVQTHSGTGIRRPRSDKGMGGGHHRARCKTGRIELPHKRFHRR